MYRNKKQVRSFFCVSIVIDTIGAFNMKKDIRPKEYIEKLKEKPSDGNCPIRKTLELLSGKWRTYVLFELCKNPVCRFGELKKAIPGITNTMLTSTLRELENRGIVNRKQYNEIPPRVEYSLTENGKALLPIFVEIGKWSDKFGAVDEGEH